MKRMVIRSIRHRLMLYSVPLSTHFAIISPRIIWLSLLSLFLYRPFGFFFLFFFLVRKTYVFSLQFCEFGLLLRFFDSWPLIPLVEDILVFFLLSPLSFLSILELSPHILLDINDFPLILILVRLRLPRLILTLKVLSLLQMFS